VPTTLTLRLSRMRLWVPCAALLLLAALTPCCVFGQSESASVSGRVTDQQNAVIPNVEVEIRNVDTNSAQVTKTNGDGIYTFPSLRPGNYVMSVRKEQFQTVSVTGIILNVQDNLSRNFVLQIGSSAVSVTVTADQNNINTTDASVSTVVDRQFAENLPLNGRSFQTLIQLTPGVVSTVSDPRDSGQFSINGQRAASNYWMVDGVSANIGIGSINTASPGDGLSGALASFSALGGTNSLVSVDALQEFRIQTSSYAPEFGRTPGGQISIVTRSGTNQFHGTLFDYLRNDVLDANDWFANFARLPKPKERQNDFGGTVSGPILRDRTFFFFSYEGLRLQLPQVVLSLVPDLSARQSAIPAMQPYLKAYPLPNGTDNLTTGIAQYNASFSNSGSLDAYSLRIDHRLNKALSLFARYNYSPSNITQRGGLASSLNTLVPTKVETQTSTAGITWNINSTTVSDLRFNYSKTDSRSYSYLDDFGGAAPLAALPFPNSLTPANARLVLPINSLSSSLQLGLLGHNIQKQINIVQNVSVQKGTHTLKVGVDYRRLSPFFGNPEYLQQPTFPSVASARLGTPSFTVVLANRSADFLFQNLGVFAQDTWRAYPRLTITYGLRWDVDFAPSSNPALVAATGFDLNNLSNLALAPAGTAAFNTPYGNVAPRAGVAYQLSQNQRWQTVIRGGFGIFFDLATSEVGNNITGSPAYPFGARNNVLNTTFPLNTAAAAPPVIAPPSASVGTLRAFDPNMQLPYTLEWNVALEQGLGADQTISASYVGSAGRRLIQTAFIVPANANLHGAELIANGATSDYDALQVQLQRRLSQGLQFLASYTWSHSIDSASAGSILGNPANTLVPGINPNQNRGPSDFDIRHSLSGAVTYSVPGPNINAFLNGVLRGWSLQNVVQARTAPPLTPLEPLILLGNFGDVRPNLVPGKPLYFYGSQCLQAPPAGLGAPCPGGKGLNPQAFSAPASGQQGNFPRNALRAFGAAQWDLAVHREFPIRESLKLQFRAEMFNVLNHPNFGPPVSSIGAAQFGQSTKMLGQSLANNSIGSGGFSPLYQIGGPRSIQLALKVQF
jgi:hypothetical protein